MVLFVYLLGKVYFAKVVVTQKSTSPRRAMCESLLWDEETTKTFRVRYFANIAQVKVYVILFTTCLSKSNSVYTAKGYTASIIS